MNPSLTHIYVSEARLLQCRQLSAEVDPVCRDTHVTHPVERAHRSNNIGEIFPDKRLLNEKYFILAVTDRGNEQQFLSGLQLGFSFYARKRRMCSILQVPHVVLRSDIGAFQADGTYIHTLLFKLFNTLAAWSSSPSCTTPTYARPALLRTYATRLLYQPSRYEHYHSSKSGYHG